MPVVHALEVIDVDESDEPRAVLTRPVEPRRQAAFAFLTVEQAGHAIGDREQFQRARTLVDECLQGALLAEQGAKPEPVDREHEGGEQQDVSGFRPPATPQRRRDAKADHGGCRRGLSRGVHGGDRQHVRTR